MSDRHKELHDEITKLLEEVDLLKIRHAATMLHNQGVVDENTALRAEVERLKAAEWYRSLTREQREAANFYADLEGYKRRAEAAEAELAKARKDLTKLIDEFVPRIRQYLGNGGLFNPEYMDAHQTSLLLRDILDALAARAALAAKEGK